MSIRSRLALFGLFVVSLTLALFILVFYGLFTAAGSNTQNQELSKRADQALAALENATSDEFKPHRVPVPIDPSESNDIFVILLGEDGTPISSTGEVNDSIPVISAEILAVALAEGEAVATIEVSVAEAVPGEGSPSEAASSVGLRLHVRTWQRPDLGLGGYIVAAQSSRKVEDDLRGGLIFLFAAAFFAFIVAALAIWLVIGRALRPLRQLARLTDEIGLTQDLARRLPVPKANDDLRRLSESFNSMMSRLEASHLQLSGALESQKRFVADASHELRTPLTTIRSNASFLGAHPEALEEDRLAAISDIGSESERMSRLVQDLLTLARADGGFHLEKKVLDLGPLIQDVVRQAGSTHPGRNLRTATASLSINGNEDAIKQLLWILIDNAARHTAEGGNIRLGLEPGDGFVRLIVADDGEGIPETHLPRVFDRFYQANAARGNSHSGLGLSIATWIVEEHNGRISARNNDHGGATVFVELPATPSMTSDPEAGD